MCDQGSENREFGHKLCLNCHLAMSHITGREYYQSVACITKPDKF